MNNKKLGNLGEFLAVCYLTLKGYKIIKRNFLVKGGELDIIAEKKGEIIIAEVKTRKDLSYGEPRDAVGYYKKKNIIYATKCYLKRANKENMRVRFDVVEIITSTFKINHLKDVFFYDDI